MIDLIEAALAAQMRRPLVPVQDFEIVARRA